MTTDTMTIKEKKLKNLRKILWICFGGFSAPFILFAMPLAMIVSMDEVMETVRGIDIPVWPVLAMSMILVTGLIGGVCLVIYHIFKYRIDKKDDNLFL